MGHSGRRGRPVRVAGRAQPDGDEIHELGWFAQDELAGLELTRWARAVLPDVVRDRRHGRFQPPDWHPPR